VPGHLAPPSPTDSAASSVLGAPSVRNRRLGSILQARAGRWDEERFGTARGTVRAPAPPPAFDLRAAFEDVTGVRAGSPSAQNTADAPAAFAYDPDTATFAAVRTDQEPAPAPPKRRDLVNVLTELYLWIQFSVIILFFVYTMVRRGPHVLEARKGKGQQ
jgi:hypothetical protein